ncbi:hypothetical protein GCM10022226_21920 [Sphaerisporangium flaviroseum]|uniref:Uncharacterized protein n=1 Tax=Sphaerisporangium flaviroseum TaxID=509199 RepID=A0ABP7HQ87_9ACTN
MKGRSPRPAWAVRVLMVACFARPCQWARPPEWLCAALRGLLAVLALLVTAADAWLTATLGLPPAAPMLRRLAEVVADAWRAGAARAIDAEIIDDPERKVWH